MTFILGMFVGVFVGFCLAALLSANGRDDEPAWQWKDDAP